MKGLLQRYGALVLCVAMLTSVSILARAQEEPPDGASGFGGGRGGAFSLAGSSAHGTVTAVSGNEISVRDEQGQVWKVLTGPNTHFRKDREEARIADIHPGDVVVAGGNLDEAAKTLGAVFVMVLNPQQAARMEKIRAEFGKTWTAGRVSAIHDLTLTVDRPDKAKQTIAVDENTSFHRRSRGTQEDITFPDIKVGDMINARGALKAGDLLATEVTVMQFPRRPAGERGEGRFGPGHPMPEPEGAPTGATPAQPPNQQP